MKKSMLEQRGLSVKGAHDSSRSFWRSSSLLVYGDRLASVGWGGGEVIGEKVTLHVPAKSCGVPSERRSTI